MSTRSFNGCGDEDKKYKSDEDGVEDRIINGDVDEDGDGDRIINGHGD